jgi:hypothetical protein
MTGLCRRRYPDGRSFPMSASLDVRRVPDQTEGQTDMTGFRRFFSSLALIGSASRVAAAFDSGRAPQPGDLRRLGIDPVTFSGIGQG